jgi:hypothetical protein
MSLTSQAAARCCRQLVRPSVRISSTTYLSQRTPSRRWNSTEAQAAAPANPKITQIVDQISQLTLLETADLVASLKVGFPRLMRAWYRNSVHHLACVVSHQRLMRDDYSAVSFPY